MDPLAFGKKVLLNNKKMRKLNGENHGMSCLKKEDRARTMALTKTSSESMKRNV